MRKELKNKKDFYGSVAVVLFYYYAHVLVDVHYCAKTACRLDIHNTNYTLSSVIVYVSLVL